jgi:hypothetical protein
MISSYSKETGALQVNLPQAGREFKMNLRLANLFYDSTDRRTKASVRIEVTATGSGSRISSVVFSLQQNPDHSFDWLWIEGADLKQSSVPVVPGAPPASSVSSVEDICGDYHTS